MDTKAMQSYMTEYLAIKLLELNHKKTFRNTPFEIIPKQFLDKYFEDVSRLNGMGAEENIVYIFVDDILFSTPTHIQEHVYSKALTQYGIDDLVSFFKPRVINMPIFMEYGGDIWGFDKCGFWSYMGHKDSPSGRLIPRKYAKIGVVVPYTYNSYECELRKDLRRRVKKPMYVPYRWRDYILSLKEGDSFSKTFKLFLEEVRCTDPTRYIHNEQDLVHPHRISSMFEAIEAMEDAWNFRHISSIEIELGWDSKLPKKNRVPKTAEWAHVELYAFDDFEPTLSPRQLVSWFENNQIVIRRVIGYHLEKAESNIGPDFKYDDIRFADGKIILTIS